MSDFWTGFGKQASYAKHIGVGALLGGGLGAGAGYGLSNDSDFLNQVVKETGLKPGTPAYQEFMEEGAAKARRTGAITGGLAGALGGGLGGAHLKRYKDVVREFQNAWQRAQGAGGGRTYGAGAHRAARASDSVLKKRLNLSGNEKTKAEVKKKWQREAMQHHPDRGGSTDRMSEINDAYDQIRNTAWFQKLAMSRKARNAWLRAHERRVLEKSARFRLPVRAPRVPKAPRAPGAAPAATWPKGMSHSNLRPPKIEQPKVKVTAKAKTTMPFPER